MANKGILGRKLGMTQVFDDANRVIPVTVIEAGPCRVVQLKTPERDGYAAVQLAFGDTKAQRLSKPELGHLKAAERRSGEVPRRAARRRPVGLRARPGPEGRRVRGRRAGRRHRHQQGSRVLGRDEAPQLLGPGRVATATTRSTARPARSARAPRRRACSRACAWPASTATRGSRRSTSRSSKATPSATCC